MNPPDLDLISAYAYVLPEELIARVPTAARDESRLMVVDRRSGVIEHRRIRDFPSFLRAGDVLVMNDTQVVPARLVGVRTKTGGRWEGLFLRAETNGDWWVIGQTRGRLEPGESLTLAPAVDPQNPARLKLQLIEKSGAGEWRVRPDSSQSPFDLLQRFGAMPLPPYLHRDEQPLDRERYQTVYAQVPGAVAAPTAGLHFTPGILQQCRDRGVDIATVTLHVGLGTFRPVSVERLDDHVMHREWCELTEDSAQKIAASRARGGRTVAVGTTSVRTLESLAGQGGELAAGSRETNLFIRPPYRFRATDMLLTNFHLPKSTLLVLVSAFAGYDLALRAYREAIAQRYRFFSYGDAMLIVSGEWGGES